MKSPVLLFVALIMLSCSSSESIVESDYSYDGTFNKYRTFDFITNQGFEGTVNDEQLIEQYLGRILKAWGYHRNERKPNLLIFYSFYFDDVWFQGFNQPQFQGWVRSNYSDNQVIFKKDTLESGKLSNPYVSTGKHDENYDKVRYTLKQGTILITLFDRKKQKTVWQGYASGVFGENLQKNERIMKSAIVRILDEYKLLAFAD